MAIRAIQSQGSVLSMMQQQSAQEKSVQEKSAGIDREEMEFYTVDAISMQPLVDPVIDKCGHTLNRDTFFGLARVKDDQGVEDQNLVLCPFSMEQVYLDELVGNLYAKNVSGYLVKHRESCVTPAQVSRIIKEVNQEADARMKNFAQQCFQELAQRDMNYKAEMMRVTKDYQAEMTRREMNHQAELAAVNQNVARLEKSNKDLSDKVGQEGQRVEGALNEIRQQNADLLRQKAQVEGQVQNLLQMVWHDRLKSWVFPSHLGVVQAREIVVRA